METDIGSFSNRFLSMIPDKRCKRRKCESTERREEHFQGKKAIPNHKKGKLGSSTKTCAPSSSPWKGKNDSWSFTLFFPTSYFSLLQ